MIVLPRFCVLYDVSKRAPKSFIEWGIYRFFILEKWWNLWTIFGWFLEHIFVWFLEKNIFLWLVKKYFWTVFEKYIWTIFGQIFLDDLEKYFFGIWKMFKILKNNVRKFRHKSTQNSVWRCGIVSKTSLKNLPWFIWEHILERFFDKILEIWP